MNIMIALVTGVLIGWGSRVKSGTDGREELVTNIVVGAVGAYLGGWILTAIYEPSDSGSMSLGAVVAATLGAATALVVVNRIGKA